MLSPRGFLIIFDALPVLILLVLLVPETSFVQLTSEVLKITSAMIEVTKYFFMIFILSFYAYSFSGFQLTLLNPILSAGHLHLSAHKGCSCATFNEDRQPQQILFFCKCGIILGNDWFFYNI